MVRKNDINGIFLIFFYLLMLGNSVIAQELPPLTYKFDKELKSELNQSMSSLESLLIVDTSLPELSFESSNSIISVKHLEGKYILNLVPGTHIITFKAKDYSPLSIEHYFHEGDTVGVMIKSSSRLKRIIRGIISFPKKIFLKIVGVF